MPYLDKVMQLTAIHSGNFDKQTPIKKITGETPNISKYIDFRFYNWVIHKNKAGPGEICLVRFLDVSHGVGSLMSYWILTESVIPILRITIQRVPPADLKIDVMKQRFGTFDKARRKKFKDDVILEQGE